MVVDLIRDFLNETQPRDVGGDIQWKHVGKVEKQTKNLVNSHSVSIQSYSVCFNCTWAYYAQVRSVTNSSGVLGITASLQQKDSNRRRSCPGFADTIQQRSGTRALAHSGLGGQNASADRWIASWIGWKQGGLAKKGPGFSSEISDSWSSWCIWRSYLCEHPDGCCVVNWEDDGISCICLGLCTCVYTHNFLLKVVIFYCHVELGARTT